MYQVEIARSTLARFYMPCHLLTVFVCACVRDGQTLQYTDVHRRQNVLRGFRLRKTLCFKGLLP